MALQDKVKCVGTEDVFFDTVDHMSAEHDSFVNEVFGYEFWRSNEPKSVKERRHTFLREMGFIQPCSLSEPAAAAADNDDDHEELELERMVEISETVSSSCSSSTIDYEEDNESEDDHPIRPSLSVYEDEEVSTSKSNKSINKKIRHWWKDNVMKKKQRGSSIEKPGKLETSRTKVQVNKKKFKELSALFEAQEIQAHKGVIWTMKFSPDGQYLATGGEDGVVRVWLVKTVDSFLERFPEESNRENKVEIIPVIIPDKMFKIEEVPVQEFHGHTADVLDLSWSDSNYLLSSSMDKTVRLWQLGSDTCLTTFHHTDYVTCVQFNPIDNRDFISGSIDGKVRIWGVSKERVLDWVDIRDAVTAVCYQPDGQAFIVGSLSGNCRFYETKGKLFELSANISLHSNKRSSTNRITGIQFSSEDSQRVIVSSEDSKTRILDKMDVVCKFRGLPKSGSQMSASITSNEKHIISIGKDSRVYVWNNEKPVESLSSHTKSIRSCEHFQSEGVSVAVPWCGTTTLPKVSSINHEAAGCIAQSPPKMSLISNMFSSKSSAIWPEDMLPVFTEPEDPSQGRYNLDHFPTWGLVVVTANSNGTIRTFHNYGLPTRA